MFGLLTLAQRIWAYPGPAADARAVGTTADTDFSAGACPRAFRVGTAAGDVRVKTLAGTVLTVPGVQVGETVALGVQAIYASGTTAAGIVVLF